MQEMAMSRRRFAMGAAAAVAAGALSACGAMAADAQEQPAGDAQDAAAEWDLDVDVVIVGGGGAAHMAAAAAHEAGASSVIIEKADATGGDTAISSCFTIGLWPDRTKADSGMDDDLETYLADQWNSHPFSHKGLNGEDMIDQGLFERQASLEPETFQWLTDVAGVEWQSYYYGSACTTPQPGWDTVAPRDWAATTGVYLPLRNLIDEYDDVEVVMGTEVLDIVKDAQGRAIGVRAANTADGTPFSAHARRGVIIATGNINVNREMVAKNLGEVVASLPDGGRSSITGDGHRMALRAGGTLHDMDLGTHWMPLMAGSNAQDFMMSMLGAGPVYGTYMPGILVNYDGVRFTNENVGYSLTGRAVSQQRFSLAWYIVDAQAVGILTSDPADVIVAQADTLEELAARMGVPAEALVAEVEKYNGYVDAGEDADFGKALEGCPRIEQSPYLALPILPHPYCGYGGITVDEDTRVLDAQGEPIPGLFAAGMCTGSIAEHVGVFYTGGISQTMVFGRLAGQMAAAEQPVD